MVKPIPTTVIGFSVLKNYNHASQMDGREYWGLREYKVHLFGREIKFQSLAFQEQDSVLSACATTAIWTMLNKAATDFHTTLKSPSQITNDAGKTSYDGGRLFPNKGLTVLQIGEAILNSGLVSEIKRPDILEPDDDTEDHSWFVSNLYAKKIVNAYAPLGIPVILVISVPDGEEHGLHAITITGHHQNEIQALPLGDGIKWNAENIDRFYAHDDQWGPFVRIMLENQSDLITPWTDNHPSKLPTRITNIVVSLFPKVRISYEDIEAIVIGLDTIFNIFFNKKNKYHLVWDIKINYSEAFKTGILTSSLNDTYKLAFATRSLPKYLWIATCYLGTFKLFDFTFDATDVNNGTIGNDVVSYLPAELTKMLRDFLIKNESTLLESLYYDWLIKKLSQLIES